MGFDRPIGVQYVEYISNAFKGDFGESWWQRTPALPIAVRPIPATFRLGIMAITLAVGLGIPIGVYAALHPNSWLDRLAVVMSLLGVAVPLIWLGPILMLLFSVKLGWLPTSGVGTWQHMVLPIIGLTVIPLGRVVQVTRASMIDELVKLYVTTARAKGLTQRIVLMRHALKNAILPTITVSGWEFVCLVTGHTIIIEAVFGYPGIGFVLYSSILLRDTPLIAATAFVIAIIVVIINFIVDIIYAIANPLIRYT
jgi:ABC-type dipeptide/oligopeptide/nickel transport system permease component